MTSTRLDDESIERVARRVVELLREDMPPPGALVDASTLASALGISRATVYEHAEELGAVRIGDGKRPRLRFDLTRACAAWAARDTETPPEPITVNPPRRRPRPTTGVPLLPIGSKRREAA